MKVSGADSPVVASGKVFGVVVPKVVSPGFPVNNELALPDPVTNPVESHVDCFGSLLLDCVVADALSAGVVRLDGSGWLGVAKKFERVAEHAGILSIVE